MSFKSSYLPLSPPWSRSPSALTRITNSLLNGLPPFICILISSMPQLLPHPPPVCSCPCPAHGCYGCYGCYGLLSREWIVEEVQGPVGREFFSNLEYAERGVVQLQMGTCWPCDFSYGLNISCILAYRPCRAPQTLRTKDVLPHSGCVVQLTLR